MNFTINSPLIPLLSPIKSPLNHDQHHSRSTTIKSPLTRIESHWITIESPSTSPFPESSQIRLQIFQVKTATGALPATHRGARVDGGGGGSQISPSRRSGLSPSKHYPRGNLNKEKTVDSWWLHSPGKKKIIKMVIKEKNWWLIVFFFVINSGFPLAKVYIAKCEVTMPTGLKDTYNDLTWSSWRKGFILQKIGFHMIQEAAMGCIRSENVRLNSMKPRHWKIPSMSIEVSAITLFDFNRAMENHNFCWENSRHFYGYFQWLCNKLPESNRGHSHSNALFQFPTRRCLRLGLFF